MASVTKTKPAEAEFFEALSQASGHVDAASDDDPDARALNQQREAHANDRFAERSGSLRMADARTISKPPSHEAFPESLKQRRLNRWTCCGFTRKKMKLEALQGTHSQEWARIRQLVIQADQGTKP